jgi:glycerophosphoryl diester phosphodiesterase
MPQYSRKIAIAHRGASGYAPEHTLEAYRLAIDQHADYVEQDLQITKDGVLVCLHDVTLERTTNVKDVFPTRGVKQGFARHWFVWDFTLAEIKELDAGSWFGPEFRGATIPTWQEAINLVRGKAGLFPETKKPELYEKRGFNMDRLLAESLVQNGLDQSPTAPMPPVIIQSFSSYSLKRLSVDHGIRAPMVLLVDLRHAFRLTAERLQEIRSYAEGIGPAKQILLANPNVVKRAHAAGLTVTPYTFRQSDRTRFQNVKEEMAFFLNTLGVDAVFTDNPDMFPR